MIGIAAPPVLGSTALQRRAEFSLTTLDFTQVDPEELCYLCLETVGERKPCEGREVDEPLSKCVLTTSRVTCNSHQRVLCFTHVVAPSWRDSPSIISALSCLYLLRNTMHSVIGFQFSYPCPM